MTTKLWHIRSWLVRKKSTEVFDNEIVPSSLASIAPILRVATEIESERPRVAYLCRSYAFEKARMLDPSSSGHGVKQFKTALLQRLERDNASSLASRVKKTDAREIESFYGQYYEHNVVALEQGEQADRAAAGQLGKAYQAAGVLFEVLCAVNNTEKVTNRASNNRSRSAAMTSKQQRKKSTEVVFDNEIVPSSLASIAPILRVATEMESERPRVAYLCQSYAFEKARRLDPSSSGRDVRQFKTALLQRLERDNASSLASRVKKTDAREIESFYQQYYEHNVRALEQGEQAERATAGQLGKAHQAAGVLFEVLCAVNKTEKAFLAADHQVNLPS